MRSVPTAQTLGRQHRGGLAAGAAALVAAAVLTAGGVAAARAQWDARGVPVPARRPAALVSGGAGGGGSEAGAGVPAPYARLTP